MTNAIHHPSRRSAAVRRKLATFVLATSAAAAGFGQGAPDLAVKAIDTDKLQCGTGAGTAELLLTNTGRDVGASYNVFVELKVSPGGYPQNARTFKERLSGFRNGEQKISFRNVRIPSCSNRASVFEANVYVTGGNFREGNTRNNKLKVTETIRRGRGTGAPTTGSSSNASPKNSGGGSSTGPSTGGPGSSPGRSSGGNDRSRVTKSTDLLVKAIDVSDLTCGTKAGNAELALENVGRDLGSAYNVFVELKVSPGGYPQNARTFKERFSGFRNGKKTVTFRNVRIPSCSNRASVFEANVYVTGGNFREGNTRNNKLKVTETIRAASGSGGVTAATDPGRPGPSAGPTAPNRNRPSTSAGNAPGRTGSSGDRGRVTKSTDLLVRAIDVSGLTCGTKSGNAELILENAGRDLGTGYNVFVELKVSPGGYPQNARTFKESLRGFRNGEQKITFRNVRIPSCSNRASVFEANVYVTGGNFREGNTRNNKLKVTETIRSR